MTASATVPMRAVVGTDGSAASDVAVALVAGMPWPAGSVIRVVSVLDLDRVLPGAIADVPFDIGPIEEQARSYQDEVSRDAVRLIEGHGRQVERATPAGRPSVAIVDEADRLESDLIVVGSRGRDPWQTMLLGSVSAEVVDRARSPVLVVRTATLGRAILALDGSLGAAAAADVVATWPILAGVPIEVLSVLGSHEMPPSPPLTILQPTHDQAMGLYGRALAATRGRHEEIAREASRRLTREGRESTWDVREGDPAKVIVDEAQARGADLIVMGTRGLTGLDRLLLGSVARSVLTHAHCSVLVVHAPGGPAAGPGSH
jgi:nucleotide-binding universal stress UspA family protein